MVNFTGNDTIAQFSEYIYAGMERTMGNQTLLGLTFLLFIVLFCYFAHLPLDGSAFIIFFAILILAMYGFLPISVSIIALMITAAIVAWVFFKVFGLK